MAELLDRTRLRLIFLHVEFEDLPRVALVCKSWNWSSWSKDHRYQLLKSFILSRIRSVWSYRQRFMETAFRRIQEESPQLLQCSSHSDVEKLVSHANTIADEFQTAEIPLHIHTKWLPSNSDEDSKHHRCFEILTSRTIQVTANDLFVTEGGDPPKLTPHVDWTHLLITENGYDIEIFPSMFPGATPLNFIWRHEVVRVYRNGEFIFEGPMYLIRDNNQNSYYKFKLCHNEFTREDEWLGTYHGSLAHRNQDKDLHGGTVWETL